jgi:hypothetical protein
MKLSQLAAKPQLIKLELNDEITIKDFGEPVEFWTWDRQPLDIFMKLASVKDNNMGDLIGITKNLILDEQGKEIITKENMLPTSLLVAAISKITETLGK